MIQCRACPRLVAWREQVAVDASGRRTPDESTGAGRCPASGTRRPACWCVGLAPAAHGGNRTGRVFTGDRSGDWLFGALHRAGLRQPDHEHVGRRRAASDGRLGLGGGALRAAGQQAHARGARPLRSVAAARAGAARPLCGWCVALGQFAWRGRVARLLRRTARGPDSATAPRRRSRRRPRWPLVGCYHLSQQNTFTGKLTEPMLDAVFARLPAAPWSA